jgi:hypothetical protein
LLQAQKTLVTTVINWLEQKQIKSVNASDMKKKKYELDQLANGREHQVI